MQAKCGTPFVARAREVLFNGEVKHAVNVYVRYEIIRMLYQIHNSFLKTPKDRRICICPMRGHHLHSFHRLSTLGCLVDSLKRKQAIKVVFPNNNFVYSSFDSIENMKNVIKHMYIKYKIREIGLKCLNQYVDNKIMLERT